MNAPQRLLIVAPNWLGDAVMALPLVADVCRGWPDTHVTVAARAAIAALFRDGRRSESRGEPRRRRRAERDRGRRSRTRRRCITASSMPPCCLPNSFIAAWIAARAAIPERWGYRDRLARAAAHEGHSASGDASSSGAVLPGAWRRARLAVGPALAHVNVTSEARARARAAAGRGRPSSPAARSWRWPRGRRTAAPSSGCPSRFAELAATLERERQRHRAGGDARGRRCLPGDCGGRAASAGSRRRGDRSLGRTDLEALASVLALARAVVANDSGAMHLAAAVGTRVIAVFGATNESKTAPLAAGAGAPAASIVAADVWCRPCMLRECPIDHRCMTAVSARMVYEAYETSRISRS